MKKDKFIGQEDFETGKHQGSGVSGETIPLQKELPLAQLQSQARTYEEPRLEEEAGLWELIVFLLNSLPAATVAFIILAFLAVLGTIIPQEPMGTEAADYIGKYGPLKYSIMKKLGFTDIYNTVYFNLVFLWIAISSIVCTLTRLKRTISLWSKPVFSLTEKFFTARSEGYRTYQDNSATAYDFAKKLSKVGLRTHIKVEADGSASIYADKGFIRKWSALVFHIAFILILVGGAIGKIWGFNGTIPIPEGQTRELRVDISEQKNFIGRILTSYVEPYVFKLTLENFRIEYDQHTKEPDFFKSLPENEPALREYYKYFVKHYVSDLIGEYKQDKVKKRVVVNHPLGIGKTLFYQSSFQQTGYAIVSFDGVEKKYPLKPSTAYQVTSDGDLVEVRPQMADPNGSEVLFHPEPQGGVFPVKAGPLFEAGKEAGTLEPIGLFQIIPPLENGQRFILLNTKEWFKLDVPGHNVKIKMAPEVDDVSIFQYSHDPGTAVVFTGWITLIVGVLVTLYVPFIQIFMRWEKGKILCVSNVHGAADKTLGYSLLEKSLTKG